MMLNLKTESPERWLAQVDNHLDEILIDHAHCENKAARAALNLLMSYVENEELTVKMTEIVNEELEHFLDRLVSVNLDWIQTDVITDKVLEFIR